MSKLRPSSDALLSFRQSSSFSHHIFHGSISAVTSMLSIAQTRPDGELLTLALTWSFPPKSRAESLGSDGTRAGCAENSKVRMFA